MKQFFKIVLGSMVGFFLAAALFVVFTIICITIVISSSKKTDIVEAKPNSILTINLSHPIAERTSYDGVNFNSITDITSNKNLGLYELIQNIRKAKIDNNISGIYIDAKMVQAGWATIEAVRDELIEFKKSKKFVVAYADLMSQKSYYLSSAADKIYINPKGIFEFSGLSVNIMFLKNTLDKLGIEPQIFYCGKFKSATEPLRLTKMSDANRLQTNEFMNDFYLHFMNKIAISRNIQFDTLDAISKNLKVRTPNEALQYHLVDGLKYYDEMLDELNHLSGNKSKTPKLLAIDKYDGMAEIKEPDTKNKLAVVFAEGDIVDGKGDKDNIGGEKYAEIIRKIRNDNNVKALVLRVNSPGGSAFASEVIWRELSLAKKKMPVVVSMGNYAASGGYYISCMADSIFAEPNTLTGSIGVFGILPNMQKFLEDKIGITHDGVKTGKFSDLPNLTRQMNDEEKQIIQAGVDTIYSDFLSRVSMGRKTPKAMIDSIAQGRVWSGKKAITIGLVDRIGNLDAAIACAAKLAKIKEYKSVQYPKTDNGIEEIIYQISENQHNSFIKTTMAEFYTPYQQVQSIKNWKGIQARIPYWLDVK